LATFVIATIGVGLVLALLIPLSANAVTAVILVVLLGVAGMAVPPVATGLAVRFAHSAPTPAAALAVSAFNTGIAAGSWVAGVALASELGATGPALVGVGMAAVGLVPLLTLVAIRVTRTGTGYSLEVCNAAR
jgi:DHA1 family inner membrane transport protein